MITEIVCFNFPAFKLSLSILICFWEANRVKVEALKVLISLFIEVITEIVELRIARIEVGREIFKVRFNLALLNSFFS